MWQTHAYSPAKLRKKRETDLTISIKILTKSIKMKEKRTFSEEFCRRIKKYPQILVSKEGEMTCAKWYINA